MQENTLDTNTTDTETGPKLSVLTIKEAVTPTVAQNTWQKSLASTLSNLPDPTDPFIKISDIPLKELRVEVIPTGFDKLDECFFLKKGRHQLITIAGDTSHGKSALMMQIASNVAMQGPVLVFSLEMDERDLRCRLLAPRINMPLGKILSGHVPQSILESSEAEFKKMQLYISTDPGTGIDEIEKSCFMKTTNGMKPSLVVIDYLQLLPNPPGCSNRNEGIMHLMRRLKSLSYKLECPIMIGSQVTKEMERNGKAYEMETGEGDYTPRNSYLADSSSIAKDSDVILFVVRPEQYDGTRPHEADIYCTKNRGGGKTFHVSWDWNGEKCFFHDPYDTVRRF